MRQIAHFLAFAPLFPAPFSFWAYDTRTEKGENPQARRFSSLREIDMSFDFLKIFLALVVLVNPLTAIPVFLALTETNNQTEKRGIAGIACGAIFAGMVTFTLFGSNLLQMLSISLGAFQVSGGILVFFIGMNMVNARPLATKSSRAETSEASEMKSIAVVPLAIPLLFGPGCMSTLIIYSAAATSWRHYALVIAAGGMVAAICYVCMVGAARIQRYLGKTGINIINRIMGMILAALAVEIMADGIRAIFPQLFAA